MSRRQASTFYDGLQLLAVGALHLPKPPAKTSMIDRTLSLVVPCRADEPDLGSTLESLFTASLSSQLPSGCVRELLVCINGTGPDQPSPPLLAVRDFCARHAISLRELTLSSAEQAPARQQPRSSPGAEGQGVGTCRVLLAAWRGKPRAMNTLWQWAYGGLLLFCDADVRIDPQAIACLYAQVRAEPQLGLVAAREVPMLEPKTSIWSRMGALPYRFNFGNAGGRLFLLRKDALSEPMPEDLLLEDAWLTVAVGKRRVCKAVQAQVFFVLPQTWRDYFAERVRAEGGKMQIRRQHARLLANGPVAEYPWAEFFRAIRIREYGLIFLALGIRGLARLWAWRRLRRAGFYSLYRPFLSTKRWSAAVQASTRPFGQSGAQQ